MSHASSYDDHVASHVEVRLIQSRHADSIGLSDDDDNELDRQAWIDVYIELAMASNNRRMSNKQTVQSLHDDGQTSYIDRHKARKRRTMHDLSCLDDDAIPAAYLSSGDYIAHVAQLMDGEKWIKYDDEDMRLYAYCMEMTRTPIYDCADGLVRCNEAYRPHMIDPRFKLDVVASMSVALHMKRNLDIAARTVVRYIENVMYESMNTSWNESHRRDRHAIFVLKMRYLFNRIDQSVALRVKVMIRTDVARSYKSWRQVNTSLKDALTSIECESSVRRLVAEVRFTRTRIQGSALYRHLFELVRAMEVETNDEEGEVEMCKVMLNLQKAMSKVEERAIDK